MDDSHERAARSAVATVPRSSGAGVLKKATLHTLLAYAERTLDWQRLRAIEREVVGPRSERKFLDAKKWLEKAWKTAIFLKLDERKPLRILDLGTGAAHFPFVCKYLGHEVIALDRPGGAVYKAACSWIGVAVVPHRIECFQRLPAFGHRFDLVTAFRIGFNIRTDGTLYDLPEWEFFLDDVRDNVLADGGELCLKMNAESKHTGRQYGDPELMALFANRGARFAQKGRYVIFSPLR